MQKITNFESKMRLVFGLAFATLFSTVTVSVFVINKLNDNSDWVAHTHQVIAEINATQIHFGEARVSTKNYLLTKQLRHLVPRLNAFQEIQKSLSDLQALTADNSTQQQYLKDAALAINEYETMTASVIADFDNSTSQNRTQLEHLTDRTEPAGRKVAGCFTNMRQEEERLLEIRNKVATSFVNQAYSIMPFMLAIQVAITAYIYYGVLNHSSR